MKSALIFSLIIFGCFLLGALIDKYLRMKAMREFARRYREAESDYIGFVHHPQCATRQGRYFYCNCQKCAGPVSHDQPLPIYTDGHGNDITHIANGEPL